MKKFNFILFLALFAAMSFTMAHQRHLPPLAPGQVWIKGANPFVRETNTVLGVWDGYVQYTDYSNGHIRYQSAHFFVRDSTRIK